MVDKITSAPTDNELIKKVNEVIDNIPTTTDNVTSGSSAALTSGGAYTALGNKLDTSKVKSTSSSISGDVYDVTYINTMLGNIETLLGGI